MPMTREQELTHWVQQQLNDVNLSIDHLPGDASFRRYARVYSQGTSYILMDAPPEKEDCKPFVAIDHWFDQHDVRVPHIVAEDMTQGFILLEDFGDVLLSQVLNADTADQYYRQAMDQLLHLQQLATQDVIIPDYSFEKLMTEMSLFDEWLIEKYLKLELSTAEQQLLQQTYTVLANDANAQPQVVVHRDYHSRNLMVLKDQSHLGIIDFQDAVVGAYTYDLISILRDAYVQWPASQVQQWMQYFWQKLPDQQKHGKTLDDFAQEFDFMAAQRHLKVLGIFIRLNLRDGKTGYMKDLPLVFHYLLQETGNYPQLAAFHRFLQQRVLPAFLSEQPQSRAMLEGMPG